MNTRAIDSLITWASTADCRSPRIVAQWVYGYAFVSPQMGEAYRRARTGLTTNPSMDAATALLLGRESEKDATSTLVAIVVDNYPSDDVCTQTDADAINSQSWFDTSVPHLQTRPGMILGKSSVARLKAQIDGYLQALLDIAPDRYATEHARLRRFENGLRTVYRQPNARWDAILQVYAGECHEGVAKFVELWLKYDASP